MTGPGWPAGWHLRELTEVDSTMAEAARLAPTLEAPEWILAHRQTGGRGRRGRSWTMPAGNLAATVVLGTGAAPAEAALRSFTAALALAEAVDSLTGRPEQVALKWPNDVLLNGGKVAGILLESLPKGRLAVGFGVNLAAAPDAGEVEPGAVRPVSLAGETGLAVPPMDALVALAAAFDRWETCLTAEGFAPIRKAWLSRAARLGQRIAARTGTQTQEGIFEGIDAGGHLLLRQGSQTRSIPAADVFF